MILPTRVKIGRLGVPTFYVGNLAHPPIEFLSRFIHYRNWSVTGYTDSTVKVRIEGKVELELTLSAWTAVFSEWVYWERHYAEFIPRNLRTVLDVGAGCGETALFYFLHGAEKIICVEPEPDRARLLEKNSRDHGWNTSIVQGQFHPRFLEQFDFDFMKMDCEGCESELLNIDMLPPCVIEVHGRKLFDGLTTRFPRLEIAELQQDPKFDLWILGSRSRIEASHKNSSSGLRHLDISS